MKEKVKQIFNEGIQLRKQFITLSANVDLLCMMADRLISAFEHGNKVLLCGNGGSAADAQHIAAELVGRFELDVRKALPAIALTTDTSVLTAVSNDYGYDNVFSRQVEALGTPGDVLIALSTSGNSKNIVKAIEKANAQGMTTISLLGGDGGICKTISIKQCLYRYLIRISSTVYMAQQWLAVYYIICCKPVDLLCSEL